MHQNADISIEGALFIYKYKSKKGMTIPRPFHIMKMKSNNEVFFMADACNYLYDVSMSYVNSGWQERYCQLVKHIDRTLKKECGEFFADLQLYQTGPMNYVVVAVYYDVPGVLEALPTILQYVNRQYRDTVGQNVRRKQILKFDLAKKLHGQQMNCVKVCEDTVEKEDEEHEQSTTDMSIEEGAQPDR